MMKNKFRQASCTCALGEEVWGCLEDDGWANQEWRHFIEKAKDVFSRVASELSDKYEVIYRNEWLEKCLDGVHDDRQMSFIL